VLENTCVRSNQQEENIAEPSSVEKHQSEESEDLEKKEDKKTENHQEVEQDIVHVVQRPHSPNVIDFDNKKMLIRLDQTESTNGKNVVIDISDAQRMMKSKNSDVRVQKVNERKRKSAPKLKPTIKQLLDKYILHKANNVFSRLGGTKRLRFPSQPGGHERWRGNSYNQQSYFAVAPKYWSCAPLMYQQFPPLSYNHWAPYSAIRSFYAEIYSAEACVETILA
jgi:hypothetical protein